MQEMKEELATQREKMRAFEQQFGQRLRRRLTKLPERFKKP